MPILGQLPVFWFDNVRVSFVRSVHLSIINMTDFLTWSLVLELRGFNKQPIWVDQLVLWFNEQCEK